MNNNQLPIVYFDGGSRGNPGEAAGAAVIVMPDNQHYTVSKFLNYATNNEAEYTGLIIGLQKAQELGIEQLEVRGDSQLVINQVNGTWKVNKPHIRELFQEACHLINGFQKIKVNWVRREENHLADSAVNECLDRELGISNKNESNLPQDVPGNSEVAKLIKLGKKARFKDYASLKSGSDEYTLKGLPALRKIVPEEVQKAILADWDGNDKYLAKVYRWYLRGLPPDMALRKVITDAEIEKNATGKHPWKTEVKATQKISHIPDKTCHYAQGDVVVITQKNNTYFGSQAVIISEPEHLNNGSWRIILEVQESQTRLQVKDYDITDLTLD